MIIYFDFMVKLLINWKIIIIKDKYKQIQIKNKNNY